MAPLFNELEDLILHSSRMDWRPLWESANEFVQKFFGTDLKVERITTILNTNIKELFNSKLCKVKNRWGGAIVR